MLFRRVAAFLFVACFLAGAARGEQRVFVDSHSTNLDPKNEKQFLIVREVPRQALLIALSDDLGLTCIDATAEPDAVAGADDIKLDLTSEIAEGGRPIHLKLYDGKNEITADSVELRSGVGATLDTYIGKTDELVHTKWKPLLADRLKTALRPPKWDPALPAPDGVDKLLEQVDFSRAFLAARLTHRAIAETGASPARLGALVRAYAHLGESTRHLVSAQSDAFFARSAIYAERLIRLDGENPASYWHQAYAMAFLGTPQRARRDFTTADKLAKGREDLKEPKWLAPLREFVYYDTVALVDRLKGPESSLEAYLVWRTVEHGPLKTVCNNYARAALSLNPGAVRIIQALTDESGVSMQHQTTSESSKSLNRLVAHLADEPLADKPVQAATKTAIDSRFSIDAMLQLLKAFDAQPREPRQLAAWSTYAAIVRDCQFVNAVARLTFLAYMLGSNADDDARMWMRLLKDHRHAAFIASFENRGYPIRPADPAKVAAIKFEDTPVSAHILLRHLESIKRERDPDGTHMVTRMFRQSMCATYDLTFALAWYYHDMGPTHRGSRKFYANYILRLAPGAPLANAFAVLDDWDKMQKKLPKIEETMAGNPNVAYALGCAYAEHDRPADAVRMFERAAKIVSDKRIFRRLATIQLQKNNEAGWLATWDRYLNSSEEFGLEHASACAEISKELRHRGKFKDALPYAQRAAASYSSWGLTEYGYTLTNLRRYEEAAQCFQNEAERYGDGSRYYRWCRTTGYGDLKSALAIYRGTVRRHENGNDPNVLCDIAIYHTLDGDRARAGVLFEKAASLGKLDQHTVLLLAIHRLEQGKTDAARDALGRIENFDAKTPREKAYLTCSRELNRCLADPAAIPSREGEIARLLADPSLRDQRGNVCYYFGRLCELRKRNDDAKWWYRKSLESGGDQHTCQILAATRLRALGDEYFR